jgi:hypothetical protein
MQERDVVAALGVRDVVSDEAIELGLGGQLALDEVVAAVAFCRGVGDPDDAEDALAAHDALPVADAVPRQLDGGADRAHDRVPRHAALEP